jgi:uncharacterized protein YbjT (DUF2867 family)
MTGVAVIGAAGRTSRHVLTALARRGCAATALIHRPEQADVAREHGAEATAVVDLEDPASVRAAQDAGAERLTYQSVLHPDTPGLPHHRRKSAAEAAIRASSLTWSIVRPAMYAQTVLLYVRDDTDVVGVPYSLDAHGLVGNPAGARIALGREPASFAEAIARSQPTPSRPS